jgi:hypothetical protein
MSAYSLSRDLFHHPHHHIPRGARMIPHEPRRRAIAVGSQRIRFRRLLPLFSVACGLAACGRVPGQFEIVNNQVPAANCSVPVNDNVYQGQGTLDAKLVRGGAGSAYFVFPLLKNNTAGAGPGEIDANKIVLTSFAVDISVLTAPPAVTSLVDMLNADPSLSSLLHYQTPWSGSLSSGGGELSAIVAAFPVDLAGRMLGTQGLSVQPSTFVNLRIRSFGHTTTRDMESDPLDFPVALCDGCLIANTGSCPFSVPPVNTGNPCNVAQDYPVDCCTAGNDLICPAVVSQ